MQKLFMTMIPTIFILVTHQKKLIQQDQLKQPHEVWFTDAATTFNILRFSDEFPTAGTHCGGWEVKISGCGNIITRILSNASLATTAF